MSPFGWKKYYDLLILAGGILLAILLSAAGANTLADQSLKSFPTPSSR